MELSQYNNKFVVYLMTFPNGKGKIAYGYKWRWKDEDNGN